MNNTTNSRFMTIADVQAYLNISKASAYELAHRKDFPSCRFGGCLRVPVEPFLLWVERNTYLPRTLRDARVSA